MLSFLSRFVDPKPGVAIWTMPLDEFLRPTRLAKRTYGPKGLFGKKRRKVSAVD